MYDGHVYCEEYSDLKDIIVQILNNELEAYDIEELSERIQQLYDEGSMSSTQYDDLISYVEDIRALY